MVYSTWLSNVHIVGKPGLFKQWTNSCATVQFSSVQDGICAPGKAHMCSTLSQQFPQCRFWNGSNIHQIDDCPLSSFHGRSLSSSSFHASLLQVVDHVMSLAFFPTASASSSSTLEIFETQATCDGCFAHQSICLVISLHFSMSKAVHPQESASYSTGKMSIWKGSVHNIQEGEREEKFFLPFRCHSIQF